MNLRIRITLVAMMLAIATLVPAVGAAVIVSVESKTVDGSYTLPTIVQLEVFVSNDDPLLQVSGFQLKLGTDAPISFFSADNTTDRTPIFGADAFLQVNSGTSLQIAKLGSQLAPLLNNGGLARVTVSIPANTFGTFPIRLITLADDPDFGTALSGDSNAPIPLPITTQNGSITVVPEPAVLGPVLMLMGCARRGRRSSI